VSDGETPAPGQPFRPDRIVTWVQLLATWPVTLVLVEGILVGAAATLRTPAWGPALLLIAAVVNVPLFLGCLFLLQTRFRPQMQPDDHYERYLREERAALERSRRLERELQRSGLEMLAVVDGRDLQSAPPDAADRIRRLTALVDEVVHRLEDIDIPRPPPLPIDVLLPLGRAFMAQKEWDPAARYLDLYVTQRPDDWQAQLSRGVAHANARRGDGSNVAALRAYSEALVFAPDSTDPRWRARTVVNRAATFRRLRRIPEARADLELATELSRDPDIRAEALYNRACLHAMLREREQTIAAVAELRDLGRTDAVRGHLHDYFAWLRDDPEFRAALGPGQAVKPTAEHPDWDGSRGGEA